MLELIRKANRHWIVSALFLSVGGVLMHFAVESWTKAAMIMGGALLLDIAVDLAFTNLEQKAGEID